MVLGFELVLECIHILPPLCEFFHKGLVILLDAVIGPHVEVLLDVGILELLPEILDLPGEAVSLLEQLHELAIAEVDSGVVARAFQFFPQGFVLLRQVQHAQLQARVALRRRVIAVVGGVHVRQRFVRGLFVHRWVRLLHHDFVQPFLASVPPDQVTDEVAGDGLLLSAYAVHIKLRL